MNQCFIKHFIKHTSKFKYNSFKEALIGVKKSYNKHSNIKYTKSKNKFIIK